MGELATDIIPFQYESHEVRSMMIDGNPWFVASDVCNILDYTKAKDAIRILDDDEKGAQQMRTPGGNQTISIINESGLYTLILRSNKPEAKPFRKWVTSEVLPTIRKTGSYSLEPERSIAKNEVHLLPEQIQYAFDTALLAHEHRFDNKYGYRIIETHNGVAQLKEQLPKKPIPDAVRNIHMQFVFEKLHRQCIVCEEPILNEYGENLRKPDESGKLVYMFEVDHFHSPLWVNLTETWGICKHCNINKSHGKISSERLQKRFGYYQDVLKDYMKGKKRLELCVSKPKPKVQKDAWKRDQMSIFDNVKELKR